MGVGGSDSRVRRGTCGACLGSPVTPLPRSSWRRPEVRTGGWRDRPVAPADARVALGLGYAKGAARFELLVEYRPRFEFAGRANFLAPGQRESVSAKLSSVSGMLAVFADLAALGAPKAGPFAPFVGAGIGISHTRIGKTAMTFPATTTTVPGGDRTGLAWMATAGVAVELEERVTLDLAWRYTDLGEVRTPRGPGRVVWRDGSREPLPLDLAPTKARLKGHGIRLSLRYAF